MRIGRIFAIVVALFGLLLSSVSGEIYKIQSGEKKNILNDEINVSFYDELAGGPSLIINGMNYATNEGTVIGLEKYSIKVVGKLKRPPKTSCVFLENQSGSCPEGHGVILEVTAKSYCGNRVCDLVENCSSCIEDCGCKDNFECINNSCIPIYECIDDDDCNNNETCVDNECITIPELTPKNESSCGNGICGSYESYESCPADCEKPIICGDNICNEGEDCCIDCGCEEHFECINNSCAPIHECITNSDCGDYEECVDNECVVVHKSIRENESNQSLLLNLTENQTSELGKLAKQTTNIEISETTQTFTQEEVGIIRSLLNWFLSLFR